MTKDIGRGPEFVSFDEERHGLKLSVPEGEQGLIKLVGTMPVFTDYYVGKKFAGEECTHVDMATIRFAKKFRDKYGLAFGIYNMFFGNEKQGRKLCPEKNCSDILGIIRFKIAAVTDLDGELVKIGSVAPPALYELLIATNREIAVCLKHREIAKETRSKRRKKGNLIEFPLSINFFRGFDPAND